MRKSCNPSWEVLDKYLDTACLASSAKHGLKRKANRGEAIARYKSDAQRNVAASSPRSHSLTVEIIATSITMERRE